MRTEPRSADVSSEAESGVLPYRAASSWRGWEVGVTCPETRNSHLFEFAAPLLEHSYLTEIVFCMWTPCGSVFD